MFKCCNCNKIINSGEEVYIFKNITCNLEIPHCSNECAKSTKERLINNLKDQVRKIEEEEVLKETW